MNPHRLVFMGSDQFSLPILHALIDGQRDLSVEVVAAVTQPDRPAGRGRKLTPNPVKKLAVDAHLPILEPVRLRDPTSLNAVLALTSDIIIVAAYGQLLPERLLAAPQYGCLNLHPSLLPRHRGPSPVAGALLAGDTRTGATLMEMIPRMDAGPIVMQRELPVAKGVTAGELESTLANLSADILRDTLPAWFGGRARSSPQVEEDATYTTKLTKADGRVDWGLSAKRLARSVQAFNPWPLAFTLWEDRQLQLLRATVQEGTAQPGLVVGLKDGALLIGSGDGMLAAAELKLAGSRPLSAVDLVRGHPALLTAHLQ